MKHGDDDDEEDEEGDEEGERRREDDESGEGGRERKRGKEATGTQHFLLLREKLWTSQSVACGKVQEGSFKALASLALEELVRRLDSLVRVSRRVERDQKKTRARELVIAGGARRARDAPGRAHLTTYEQWIE